MASSKMKRMKQTGKDHAEEIDEDNEELFAELGEAQIPPLASRDDTLSSPRILAPTPWGTGARAPTFTNGWTRGAP